MRNTRFIVYVTFLVLFILSGHLVRIDAKKHKKKKDEEASPPASSSSSGNPDDSGSNIFDVMTYGAKGDGYADDTKFFESAWADACKGENSVMRIPSGIFLVKYVLFSGGCKSSMVVQLDGKIIAPTSREDWDSGLLQWLDFTGLSGLTIQGKGVIDGQGDVWWQDSGEMPSTKPTALRVSDSKGVTVTGLTIQNSQQAHLKFDNCEEVEVYEITINSPGNSPNTDGIHVQNSQQVSIHDNKIGCGDDCISIQTGSSRINITDVTCGPSHGISIGGLGKDSTTACVSDVTVSDCTITESDNGVRIKTWQGGSGSVRRVSFSNIQVLEVDNAIDIDQYYCGGSDGCAHKSGAVAISGVSFNNIYGSYNSYSARLACSSHTPCEDITLSEIHLTPSNKANLAPFCEYAFGNVDDTKHCLHSGGSSSSPSSYTTSNNDDGATC